MTHEHTVEIRKFRPQEQEQVHRLVSSILKQEFGLDESTYPETDLSDIAGHYGGTRDIFLVAIANGSVVGTIAIKEDDKNSALLRRIAVSPAFRGQGIAKQLIIKAIEFCQENEYRIVHFRSTQAMNAANQLCGQNGFKLRASMQLGATTMLKYTRRLRAARRPAASKKSNKKND